MLLPARWIYVKAVDSITTLLEPPARLSTAIRRILDCSARGVETARRTLPGTARASSDYRSWRTACRGARPHGAKTTGETTGVPPDHPCGADARCNMRKTCHDRTSKCQ